MTRKNEKKIKTNFFLLIVFALMSFFCCKDKDDYKRIKQDLITVPSNYTKINYYSFLKSKGIKFYDKNSKVILYKDSDFNNFITITYIDIGSDKLKIQYLEEKMSNDLSKQFKKVNFKNGNILYNDIIFLDDDESFVFNENGDKFRCYNYSILDKNKNRLIKINYFVNDFQKGRLNQINNTINNYCSFSPRRKEF